MPTKVVKPEENGTPVPSEEITAEQALNVLLQAAYQYRGTRQEHMMIEKAAQFLSPLVKSA
jgi:hypothetical protein